MNLEGHDFVVIGVLVFLEGILSIDNALVLAILARRLPESEQRRALTFGIGGAIVLRLIALGAVSLLIRSSWVKFLGGGYLLYIAIAHWLKTNGEQAEVKEGRKASFYGTVLTMMLMDLAFAVDSILAAFGVSQKLWVICTGALIGLLLLRFAAGIFVNLLKKFPNFEESAYCLIFVIGAKLVLEGFHLPQLDFHSMSAPAFWIFWGLMALSVLYGFRRRVSRDIEHRVEEAEEGLKEEEKVFEDIEDLGKN